MPDHLVVRFAERLLAALLRVYPSSFRRRVGTDLVATYRDRSRDEWVSRGWFGLVRYWTRTAISVATDGMLERLASRSGSFTAKSKPQRMDSLIQDLHYIVRSFARQPSFFFVAVATLGIGVGAATTIFSGIDGVLLAPLPYDEPARIVEVGKVSQGFDRIFAMSALDVFDLQERNRSFEALAASMVTGLTVLGGGEPQVFRASMVSPEFFSVLGVQPTLGRAFTAAEDAAATPVVVLSHGLWQQRWGGDRTLVGKTITLGRTPFTVVGIMPPDFRPPEAIGQVDVELWVPLAFVNEERRNQRYNQFLQGIGRLRPGVSHEAARSELIALGAQLTEEFPDAGERSFGLSPLHRETVGGMRGTLIPLFGAVGLLLLIACVNVANLLLVRASERDREMALRAAIGADRGRIIRQLLTESLMLGLSGGVLGVAVAWAGVRTFVVFNPGDIPRIAEVSVDGRVLGFAVAISVLTSLAFGLVPALRGSRPDLVNTLKDGAKGAGTSMQQERLRNGLVIVETSLAFVLVVGAGLLINSLVRLHLVETGFDHKNIHVISVTYPSGGSPANVSNFYDEVIRRVAALPGVTAVGATTILPLSGDRMMQSLTVEGMSVPTDGGAYSVNYQLVAADFFPALGIPLLRGRVFDDSDGPASPPVALVNEAMARNLFGDGDPIRRHFRLGQRGLREGRFEIVGVVANIRQMSLARAAVPELYFSFDQFPRRQMNVLARTDVPNTDLLAAMRAQVWSVRPDLPISRSVRMSDFVAQSIVGPRFYTLLVGGFAGVALVLALVGIYSTLSYTVSLRAHQMGVRMALGADATKVLGMVVREGLVLAAMGIGIGLAGALLLSRTLASFLFGVTTTDPTTFTVVSLILLIAAAVACYFPARRAARLDPATTLRSE